MSKKILAVLLAVLLVFGVMPAGVYADSTSVETDVSGLEQPGGGSYNENQYGHVDIRIGGSFTYIDNNGVEQTASITWTSQKVKSYFTIKNNGTEISTSNASYQADSGGEIRISDTFEKTDVITIIVKVPVSEFGLTAADVADAYVDADGVAYFTYEKDFTYYSSDNVCTGSGASRGLDVVINASDIVDYAYGKIKVAKAVNGEGAPTDAVFTFELYDFTGKYVETVTLKAGETKEFAADIVPSQAYVVKEVSIPENFVVDEESKEVTVTVLNGTATVEFVNTYEEPVTDISVVKEWAGDEGFEAFRGDVTVELYRNGEATAVTAVLSEENDWSHTFSALEKYDAQGALIDYSVVETAVDSEFAYEAVVEGSASDGYVITNTIIIPTTEVPVQKVWNDEKYEGYRPAEIIVELYANGVLQDKILSLNEDNGWEGTFTGLPAYADGEAVSYTVKETIVDAQFEYESVVSGSASDGYVITNTIVIPETEIPVQKVWNDEKYENYRPESITAVLVENGVETENTLVLSEENQWSGVFTDLPVYIDGEEVEYTVKEVLGQAKFAYETSVDGSASDGYVITNTIIIPGTEVPVEKVWEDKLYEQFRPVQIGVTLLADGVETDRTLVLSEENQWSGVFGDLPKYVDGKLVAYSVKENIGETQLEYDVLITVNDENGYVITNTVIIPETEVPVQKVWNDAKYEGFRPEEIVVDLYADGEIAGKAMVLSEENQWSGVFENLPVYVDGEKVSYTVKETVKGIFEYESVVSGSAADGYVITNTIVIPETEIPVSKVWDDAKYEGFRPEEIVIDLYADGEIAGKAMVLSEENQWSGIFENLPVYVDGEEVSYTVKETIVDAQFEYESVVSGSQESGYVITNTIVIPETEIPVQKVWNDEKYEGYRPESITAVLVENGVETDKTLILSEENQWSGVFTDLPVYIDGEEVEYTVKETVVDAQFEYESVVSGSASDGYVITNTIIIPETEVPVQKVWNDEKYEGYRPAEIIVELYANGVLQDKILSLNEDNRWSGVFENLPAYADGEEVSYTVKETIVDAQFEYESVVSGSQESGYVITNTIVIPGTEIPVQKVWNDEKYEGYRPESITAVLVENGVETDKTLVLSEENQWSGVFTDLPVYIDGEEVEYTVKETVVDAQFEYESVVSGSASDGYVITNTIIIPTTEVPVQKVWNDEGYEEFRPESVEMILLMDGSRTEKTLILSEENQWSGVFGDLPKYVDGKLVAYSVKEVSYDYHYEVTYSVADGVNVVENKYIPDPEYYVNIDKLIEGKGLGKEEFEFLISYEFDADGYVYSDTVTIKGDGECLAELEYGMVIDAPTVVITEVRGDNENCIYDDSVWTIEFAYTEEYGFCGQLYKDGAAVGETAVLDNDYVFCVEFTNTVPDNPDTGDIFPAFWAGMFIMSIMALAAVYDRRFGINR